MKGHRLTKNNSKIRSNPSWVTSLCFYERNHSRRRVGFFYTTRLTLTKLCVFSLSTNCKGEDCAVVRLREGAVRDYCCGRNSRDVCSMRGLSPFLFITKRTTAILCQSVPHEVWFRVCERADEPPPPLFLRRLKNLRRLLPSGEDTRSLYPCESVTSLTVQPSDS